MIVLHVCFCLFWEYFTIAFEELQNLVYFVLLFSTQQCLYLTSLSFQYMVGWTFLFGINKDILRSVLRFREGLHPKPCIWHPVVYFVTRISPHYSVYTLDIFNSLFGLKINVLSRTNCIFKNTIKNKQFKCVSASYSSTLCNISDVRNIYMLGIKCNHAFRHCKVKASFLWLLKKLSGFFF